MFIGSKFKKIKKNIKKDRYRIIHENFLHTGHNFKRDVQMVSSMHRFYRPDFLTNDAPSEKIAETKTADNATKTRTLDECLSLYKNQVK